MSEKQKESCWPAADTVDAQERTQLHAVCGQGTVGEAKSLLPEPRADEQADAFVDFGTAALLYAKDIFGLTALQYAAERREWDLVKLLIEVDEFNLLKDSRVACGCRLVDFVAGSTCKRSSEKADDQQLKALLELLRSRGANERQSDQSECNPKRMEQPGGWKQSREFDKDKRVSPRAQRPSVMGAGSVEGHQQPSVTVSDSASKRSHKWKEFLQQTVAKHNNKEWNVETQEPGKRPTLQHMLQQLQELSTEELEEKYPVDQTEAMPSARSFSSCCPSDPIDPVPELVKKATDAAAWSVVRVLLSEKKVSAGELKALLAKALEDANLRVLNWLLRSCRDGVQACLSDVLSEFTIGDEATKMLGLCFLYEKMPKSMRRGQRRNVRKIVAMATSHCSYAAVRLLVTKAGHELSKEDTDLRPSLLPYKLGIERQYWNAVKLLLDQLNTRAADVSEDFICDLVMVFTKQLSLCHRWQGHERKSAMLLMETLWELELERTEVGESNMFAFSTKLVDIKSELLSSENYELFVWLVGKLAKAANESHKLENLEKIVKGLVFDFEKETNQTPAHLKTVEGTELTFLLLAAKYRSDEFPLLLRIWRENLLEETEETEMTGVFRTPVLGGGVTLFNLCAQNQDLKQTEKDLNEIRKKLFPDCKYWEVGGSSGLTCLHYACMTGNTGNLEVLKQLNPRLFDLTSDSQKDSHFLEIALKNNMLSEVLDKLNETTDAKQTTDAKWNILQTCKIIDKVEFALELPEVNVARNCVWTVKDKGSSEFVGLVLEKGDSQLFRSGLRLGLWDPRQHVIRQLRPTNANGEQRDKNVIKQALKKPKLSILKDFILVTQFDLIPTCLQVLLELDQYKHRHMSEDYHEVKQFCTRVVSNCLNTLFRGSNQTERQLLRRYIRGEIEGGPRFPPSLTECQRFKDDIEEETDKEEASSEEAAKDESAKEKTAKEAATDPKYFTIYELMKFTGAGEPLATKCMEFVVDKMWKSVNYESVDCRRCRESTQDSHSTAFTVKKVDKETHQEAIGEATTDTSASDGAEASTLKSNDDSNSDDDAATCRKTPRFNFYSDCVMHAVFIAIFMYQLISMSPSVPAAWPDFVVAAYAANFLAQELWDFVNGIRPLNRRLGKKLPKKKFNHKIIMWFLPEYFTELWNILDLVSLGFLIAGLVVKFTTGPSSVVPVAFLNCRILLGVAFFCYSARTISLLRYFESMGPTISIIKSQLYRDLMPFLVIYVIVATGFGFLAFGLFYTQKYQNSQADVDFLLRVFALPYYVTFGDFSTEEWNNCLDDEFGNQTIWGKTCPRRDVTRVYMFFLILLFIFGSNIVLINLLIAKFSLTVNQKQEKARAIWRKSKAQLLESYDRVTFLPPPFFIVEVFLLIVLALIRWRNAKRKVAPTESRDRPPWWRSEDVNEYPNDYVKYLLFQAKKFREQRTQLELPPLNIEEEQDALEVRAENTREKETKMLINNFNSKLDNEVEKLRKVMTADFKSRLTEEVDRVVKEVQKHRQQPEPRKPEMKSVKVQTAPQQQRSQEPQQQQQQLLDLTPQPQFSPGCDNETWGDGV